MCALAKISAKTGFISIQMWTIECVPPYFYLPLTFVTNRFIPSKDHYDAHNSYYFRYCVSSKQVLTTYPTS